MLEAGVVLAQGSLPELRNGPVDVSRYISSPVASVKSLARGDDNMVAVDIDPEMAIVRKEELERVKEKIEKVEDIPDVDDEQLGVLGSAGWRPYKFFLQSCGWGNLSATLTSIITYAAAEVGLEVRHVLRSHHQSLLTYRTRSSSNCGRRAIPPTTQCGWGYTAASLSHAVSSRYARL